MDSGEGIMTIPDHIDSAEKYRARDEAILQSSPVHQHIVARLQDISSGFGRPIDVLDIGCGTGRYFHCLANVRNLVGVDLDPTMLTQAAHPAFADRVGAETIELIQSGIEELALGERRFDFIYSIGMFGDHVRMTDDICRNLYSLLRNDGRLFFTHMDLRTRSVHAKSTAKKVKHRIYTMVPLSVRRTFNATDRRLISEQELEEILIHSQFVRYEIEARTSKPPAANHAYLEVTAEKSLS